MNKICIDTSSYHLDIQDSTYAIDIVRDTSLKIDISENKTANIALLVFHSKAKIEINLGKNSHLTINQLGINSSIDYYSNLTYGSNLMVASSVLSSIDSINHILIHHKEGTSKCIFLANGINLSDNKLYFIMDGKIEKESMDVSLEENSKIINIKNGDSKIIPNLMVDNKEVVANHSAFIGEFSKEDLWYLNARGISEIQARKLLFKSILLKDMQLEFAREKFIHVLIENGYLNI